MAAHLDGRTGRIRNAPAAVLALAAAGARGTWRARVGAASPRLLSATAAAAGLGVALAAVELVRAQRPAAVLLLLPLLLCAAVVRAHTSEHRRLHRLRLLYEAIRRAHLAPGRSAGILELLEAPRALTGADAAWLVLLPRRRSAALLVAAVGRDGTSPLTPCTLRKDRETAVLGEAQAATARAVSVDDRGDPMHRLLSDLGLQRAVSVPLRGECDVIGLVLVGDRPGGTGRFGVEEVQLLETFAGHAAVMLENDRLEQSVNDLSALKEELHRQAYHDALTGLPNRALFSERVASSLRQEGGGVPAVLFLDLDDFKTINDSLGHHAGDELLVAVAGRVRSAVRAGDLPARLGGDEFAVLARHALDGDAEGVAERLVAALEAPFTIAGREMSVHASIGIAFGAPGVTSADELLRNADVAMYSAKHGGKRRHATYQPQMHTRVRRRQELATALERAAGRGEIAVHYQPIVDLASGRTVAVEALARWNRPDHGMLAADTFIPLAEEIGLMVEIGRVVLREACSRVASWRRTFPGMEDLRLGVNLAPSEIGGRALVEDVAAVLAETGLPPDRLVLEITESGVMRDPDEALPVMVGLRDLGVSLALDDFGTGHSSLAHLREFPIDMLKIAREFATGLPDSAVDTAFVETIVRLGRSLGLDVVAEGIESARQASAVTALGCAFAQGFYFGAPLAPLGLTFAFGSGSATGAALQVA